MPTIPLTIAAKSGAIGAPFAGIVCIPIVMGVLSCCGALNDLFRYQDMRSGRLLRNDRDTGHFPDILLFIPVFFINCLIGGIIGGPGSSSFKRAIYHDGPSVLVRDTKPIRTLSKREAAKMTTIGGLIVAPLFPFIFLLMCGVLEVACRFVGEILQGYPNPSDSFDSISILQYLWSQFGAFRRLPAHIVEWYRTWNPPESHRMAAV